MATNEDLDIIVSEDNSLPEDKVLVADHKTGGKRSFHTDPDCRYVSNTHKEWKRELAESWGFTHCKLCSNEI